MHKISEIIKILTWSGTPLNRHGIEELVEMACSEALIYKETGIVSFSGTYLKYSIE